MKAVVQRVSSASVIVSGKTVGSIDKGLLVYLGVEREDTEADLDYMVRKIPNIRMFTDGEGKMNLSVGDVGGQLLVVSQFTLCADMRKGNRPSFNPAAEPKMAETMYLRFVEKVRNKGYVVETGEFGASMKVGYVNEGPVTLIIDTRENMKQN
jgi:D-tyrosyl-tRNA(Tyr) deacylase